MARKKSLIKDLSACETVIMKVIWDAVDDIALQQLIVDLREQYGKDYARTTVVTFLGKMAEEDAMAAICNSRDISKDEIQKMRQLLDDMDD